MSITINHQTNDISSTSGSLTIDGASASPAIGDRVSSPAPLQSPEFLPLNGGVYLKSSFPVLASTVTQPLPTAPLSISANPGFAVNGIAFNETPTFVAVVGNFTAPKLRVFSVSGSSVLGTGGTIASPPTGTCNGVDWGGSSYLAVAHAGSPFVSLYKPSGSTFNQLANPDILPSNTGYDVAFSRNTDYLAVAHSVSPFVTIYKRNVDTFTKLADPDILPTNIGYGVAFSPDDNYLAVAHVSAPYVTIYKRSGDTFTKLANPDILPASTSYGAVFSEDSTYLAITHNNSPYVTIYKRSGDTFTKLANPDILPASNARSAAFSRGTDYLVVGSNATGIVYYKRLGDTFVKFKELPDGAVNSVAFSPSFLTTRREHLGIGWNSAPYMTVDQQPAYNQATSFVLEVSTDNVSGQFLNFVKAL